MSDQWSEILESYHLPSCSGGADRMECTCRMCEVITGVAQLEAENERLRKIARTARLVVDHGEPELIDELDALLQMNGLKSS